jgi:hypothetical protein
LGRLKKPSQANLSPREALRRAAFEGVKNRQIGADENQLSDAHGCMLKAMDGPKASRDASLLSSTLTATVDRRHGISSAGAEGHRGADARSTVPDYHSSSRFDAGHQAITNGRNDAGHPFVLSTQFRAEMNGEPRDDELSNAQTGSSDSAALAPKYRYGLPGSVSDGVLALPSNGSHIPNRLSVVPSGAQHHIETRMVAKLPTSNPFRECRSAQLNRIVGDDGRPILEVLMEPDVFPFETTIPKPAKGDIVYGVVHLCNVRGSSPVLVGISNPGSRSRLTAAVMKSSRCLDATREF